MNIHRSKKTNLNSTKSVDRERFVSLFDWDGTLRADFHIIDFISFVSDFLGPDNKVSETNQNLKKLHHCYIKEEIIYVEFLHGVKDEFSKFLNKRKIEDVKALAKEFAKVDKKIFNGPMDLLKKLSLSGKIYIITGSPKILIEPYFCKLSGIEIFGTEYQKNSDGTYSNIISRFFGGKKEKENAVNHIFELEKQSYFDVAGKKFALVAMGDTESDSPLLNTARYPILVNDSIALVGTGSRRRRVRSSSLGNIIVSESSGALQLRELSAA